VVIFALFDKNKNNVYGDFSQTTNCILSAL